MRKFLVISVLALTAAVALGAQDLVPGPGKPVADGVVAAGEYALVRELSGMKLHLSLSADGKTLGVGLVAPTKGWVAVGLGSRVMDGAFMVLAFDAGGKPSVSEQRGAGRSHSPLTGSVLGASAVKEAGESTTLEFSVPLSGLVAGGKLGLVLAYGTADNFTSRHAARVGAELGVKP
ncbi:MAG: hypothetical protein JNG85_12325 [Spirochaetaceae bacterium]|nr:hypothetical protein [Spirochaetaceae bacterium]